MYTGCTSSVIKVSPIPRDIMSRLSFVLFFVFAVALCFSAVDAADRLHTDSDVSEEAFVEALQQQLEALENGASEDRLDKKGVKVVSCVVGSADAARHATTKSNATDNWNSRQLRCFLIMRRRMCT